MEHLQNKIFFAVMIPLALAGLVSNPNYLFAWTDFFSNLFSDILSTIGNLLNYHPGPQLTVQQQFSGRLASLQANITNITRIGLSEAKQYNVSTKYSAAVQITDRNATNSTIIGQFTIIWNGTTQSALISNGILNTSISPTYAVRINHNSFMSITKSIVRNDVFGASIAYATAASSNAFGYAQIK